MLAFLKESLSAAYKNENRQPTDKQHLERFCAAAKYSVAAIAFFMHSALKEGLDYWQAFDLYLALRGRDMRPDVEAAIDLERRFGRLAIRDEQPRRKHVQ